MIMIKAAQRLLASFADTQQAATYLESVGFKKLKLKSQSDNLISFVYRDLDKDLLTRHLGTPKQINPNEQFWKAEGLGYIVVKELLRIVSIKNTAKEPEKIKREPKLIEVPVDGPPDIPGSHMNDDSHVPHVLVPANIMHKYAIAQGVPKAQLEFLHTLWSYFNTHKFGGLLKPPANLSLMKNTDPHSFKTRGIWYPGRRMLQVSPRLFNASINFFIEVFLHEMCHEAVTDIDRVWDHEDGGHGKNWQMWMIKVGLNPSRFDKNSNSTYMSYKEKKEIENRKKQRENDYYNLIHRNTQ